jgi:DNA-binding CsgD family transcriptional regulator/PAS domain-containing protein
MFVEPQSILDSGCYSFCHALQRAIAPLTPRAHVSIDWGRTNLCLKTIKAEGEAAPRHISKRRADRLISASKIDRLERVPAGEASWPVDDQTGDIAAFRIIFEDGSIDLVTLCLQGGAHDETCAGILAAMWPIIREDCLTEASEAGSEAVQSALLWTISKKSDAAVLVLDASGHVLHANEAGSELLEQEVVLREAGGVLRCVNDAETKALLHTLKECSDDKAEHREYIIFLEGRDYQGRLPLSLTRFNCAAHGEPLVVAMLPTAPDPKRVEMLVMKMGLTPAEARVAVLMQLGLTNRQAAVVAGLKDQTFNTYAKRVLSKLNVGCRAEMVNMLTWQSSLGRAS